MKRPRKTIAWSDVPSTGAFKELDVLAWVRAEQEYRAIVYKKFIDPIFTSARKAKAR